MTTSAEERLRRVLGGDHLNSLRKRLRQRFERAPLGIDVSAFRIGNLTREEHAALASLLGRPQHYTNSLQFDIGLADTVLQNAGIAKSLRDALEQLDGPITHLAAARLQEQNLWTDVINNCSHAGLAILLETSTGMALLKRLSSQMPAEATKLCRRAEAILGRLPAHGIPRSQLAAEVLGDAHALDNGYATATLVLAVCRQTIEPAYGRDNDSLSETANGDDAEQLSVERDRDIWAKAGVLVNELARPVLFLNLPTLETKSFCGSLGEPAYASLRLLLRSPPAWNVADRKIYVCENPNIVAIAASRLGADCAPMVCIDGMPAAAQRCLLSQLAAARAQLYYHGDFDWPGIKIGNHVMRAYGATPWRFGAFDYEDAARRMSGMEKTLTDRAVAAFWDTELGPVMQELCMAIPEERVAASLLQDLSNR